jgi:hypothetical protein
VIVPLSLVRRAPLTLNVGLLNLIFAHIFCVGIPIAFVASRVLSDSYKPGVSRPR